MKKIFSIIFTLLIILSGLQITVANHFCGGNKVAYKVSISGELATCGMEGYADKCPLPGNHFNTHCCDDIVSVYSTDDIYTPTYSEPTNIEQTILQIFFIPVSFSFNPSLTSNSFFTSVSPPDNLPLSAVSLADICVFRI